MITDPGQGPFQWWEGTLFSLQVASLPAQHMSLKTVKTNYENKDQLDALSKWTVKVVFLLSSPQISRGGVILHALGRPVQMKK